MASAAMPQFIGPWDTQIVATAIHAGHDLRPDVAAAMLLSEQDRLREEDPFTDLIAAAVPDRVVTTRSRFEVDLNRPRREAVYRRPRTPGVGPLARGRAPRAALSRRPGRRGARAARIVARANGIWRTCRSRPSKSTLRSMNSMC